ncbi:hypothetical protein [Agromyces sp. NPDC049794]|uniref:hypothetical protein n=1 Tax=unclassified Agromyces TaxID=2639701 RepID=UPI0033F07340
MSDVDGADGMGGSDGTEQAGRSPGSTGSYGTPGHTVPDPKQPVTSMDAADADADADSPEDPAAHGGPRLRDLPSTETGVVDDDASKDHGVGPE